MPDNIERERAPLVFPIILIIVGALFLFAKYHPGFEPWYVIKTYWPLILIFVGLAKIFDSTRAARAGATSTNDRSWGAAGVLIFVGSIIFLVIVLSHTSAFSHSRAFRSVMKHESQHVDLNGANSITASVQSPAGLLTVESGSSRALEADFNFAESYGAPVVDYHVASGVGQINVTQDHDEPHFGIAHNDWNL